MSDREEEPDEEEDKTPKALWVKFKSIKSLHFMCPTKDEQYLFISGGCYILVVDVKTEKEWIFRAVNEENGEGVQCLDVSRKFSIFAFSEKSLNPRIMVYSFPNFVPVNTLKGADVYGYMSLSFSEREYLISLGTYPQFEITVWNWCAGIMMAIKNTDFQYERQLLRCNFGSQLCVAQMPHLANKLRFWNVHLCHTVCQLVEEDVALPLPPETALVDCVWSPDSVLYVLDSDGDVYAMEGEHHAVTLAIKWGGLKGITSPCMTWYKSGIVISGPDGEIKLYTTVARRRASLTKGPAASGPAWKLTWVGRPKHPMAALCGADFRGTSSLFGVTERGELYRMEDNTLVQIRNYGTGIIDFDFTHELEYVATLNEYGNFILWHKYTGRMVGGVALGPGCAKLRASPAHRVLAVGRTDGAVALVDARRPAAPQPLGELALCSDPVGALDFTADGRHLLVATFEFGHIFVLKAPPCENIFVMAYVCVEEPLAEVTISQHDQTLHIVALLKAVGCCGKGGPDINVYKTRIHDQAERTKTIRHTHCVYSGFNYVSVAEDPRIKEWLCAIPHRSRQLHIFVLEAETRETARLRSTARSMARSTARSAVRASRVPSAGGGRRETAASLRARRRTRSAGAARKSSAPPRGASRLQSAVSASWEGGSDAEAAPGAGAALAAARPSGHRVRGARLRYCAHLLLTWGRDGLVVLRGAGDLKPLTAVVAHHRADGGVRNALVGADGRLLLSLGCDGVCVCTALRPDVQMEREKEAEEEKATAEAECGGRSSDAGASGDERESPNVLEFLAKEQPKGSAGKVTTGVAAAKDAPPPAEELRLIGTEKEKTWLHSRDEFKLQEEFMRLSTKKRDIMNGIREVKKQVLALIEKNMAGPENERLPIGEFDMDVTKRRRKMEEFELKLAQAVDRIRAQITAQNALVEKIKTSTWDKMVVKSQRICAFLNEFFVESYALFKPDQELEDKLPILEKRMRLTSELSKEDCFYPWIPNIDYDVVREGSILLGRKQAHEAAHSALTEAITGDSFSVSSDSQSAKLFSGSSSYQYVNVSPFHCSQFELVTFQHMHQEVVLLMKITTDLQEYFNTEFQKVMRMKEAELAYLAEKNNRRRHLLSELNISDTSVEDITWNYYEHPNKILTVEDSEVSVLPYLTPSEEDLRARLRAEEEERQRALLADDFRERALVAMMHGVLELRWEDKIKKDIPRPKCMIDKPPEEWNEEDLRAVRDYDQKVLLLMEQRRLYRKMCAKEFENIMEQQRDNMLKFDKQLHDLLVLKMKIQACIDEENLKVLRGRLKIYERIKLEKKEQEIIQKMSEVDKIISDFQEDIQDLTEAKRVCRNEYDNLVARDRQMDKSFKREFQDLHHSIVESLTKLYRRRPKMHQRAQMSGALLEELSRCTVITEPLPNYLGPDSLDFLHALELLDQHSHAPNNVSEITWNALCRIRRNKIECELKIKAMALQLAECDSTLAVFNDLLTNEKDKLLILNQNLKDVREEKLEAIHNAQLQLVMKQGFVELADTSDFGNFEDCVLINRQVVEHINAQILEAGEKKLKAMHNVTGFHRVVMCKEWEHKKLRMLIEDLKEKLKYVESVKLTRDLQQLLKLRAAGVILDTGKEQLEKKIAAYKQAYDKIIGLVKEKLEELNHKLRKGKKEGHDLDEKIINLNVDVNELILERNFYFEEERDSFRKERMKMIVRRSNAVHKIQQQFHQILLLQTELELLRLKTYPTLKYNTLS